MKVAELQAFLTSLSDPLMAAGGKKIAEDLRLAVEALTPLRDMTMTEFQTFLEQAAAYYRTGVLPVKPSAAKKAPKLDDPGKVQRVAQELMALYERAIDESVGYSVIEAAMKKLDKDLSLDQAKAVAKELGIPGSPKTKKAAIEEIHRKIKRRKESFQRTSF